MLYPSGMFCNFSQWYITKCLSFGVGVSSTIPFFTKGEAAESAIEGNLSRRMSFPSRCRTHYLRQTFLQAFQLTIWTFVKVGVVSSLGENPYRWGRFSLIPMETQLYETVTVRKSHLCRKSFFSNWISTAVKTTSWTCALLLWLKWLNSLFLWLVHQSQLSKFNHIG